MDKHYYLLINKCNFKLSSALDVIIFNTQKEATLFKNNLLKRAIRQVELDEANYGIGNPDIYLVVSDNELVYIINQIKLLKVAKLTEKLQTTYGIASRQFSPSYTKTNFSKITKFLDSLPNKTKTVSTESKSDKTEVVVLYDEDWNPIGCMTKRSV